MCKLVLGVIMVSLVLCPASSCRFFSNNKALSTIDREQEKPLNYSIEKSSKTRNGRSLQNISLVMQAKSLHTVQPASSNRTETFSQKLAIIAQADNRISHKLAIIAQADNRSQFPKIRTLRLLDEGSFGEVWLGRYGVEKVAIKTEKKDVPAGSAQLAYEAVVLQTLQGRVGIPKWFATLSFWDGLAVITERLDQTLLPLKGTLNVHRLAILAGKVVDVLESLHGAGFVHCDIKPDNLMIKFHEELGLDRASGYSLYMIDFGLSQLISEISDSRKGSPRYMSTNIMKGGQQSYADDAVSAVYSLVYLALPLQVELPWSGLTAKDDEHSRDQLILQKKESTPIEKLCEDVPKPFDSMFAKALHHFGTLQPGTPPDYKWLRGLFAGSPPV